MTDGPTLTGQQVLEELDVLARLEHALCVEYLFLHCALGHDLSPPNPQAEVAFAIAKREMRHLHVVNQALALAGRAPQLGRASSIKTASGAEIAIGPLSLEQLRLFPHDEREIAAAVDATYARVRAVLGAESPPLDPELAGQLDFLLGSGIDHDGQLARPGEELQLRATSHAPADDLERRLLELADREYGLVVATVGVWFAHEGQPDPGLGGDLPGETPALAAMDGLRDATRLLVARGLLPAFTLPS